MSSRGKGVVRLSDEVRRYYDENTKRFERYGQGGTSIHRAVWGEGVDTRVGAFHYVDDLILRELQKVRDATPKVLDLGCGVGATLVYLASRMDLVGEGITISPVQAHRARLVAAEAGVTDRVRCREGDFTSLPEDLRDVHVAFSIEAFVHGPDARRYFDQATRVLRRGGKLLVCDDFLGRTASDGSERERRWVEEFRRGWHVGSLVTIQEARHLANEAGFDLVDDRDLTPYLELGRPRDRFIGALVTFGRHLPIRAKYWAALLGGDALQRALGSGALAYHFLTFEKR